MTDQAQENPLTFGILGSEGPETDEDDSRPTEERIIDSLDEAALMFAKVLNDRRHNEDDTGFVVSWETRLELFKLLRDWVATRRRTQIGNGDNDQSGVELMRARMAGNAPRPAPKPPAKRGRPTNAEKERRETERALEEARLERERWDSSKNDDSGLKSRLQAVGAPT